LKSIWLVPVAERLTAPKSVAAVDEAFHTSLVEAAGNPEVARCHREVTERIRSFAGSISARSTGSTRPKRSTRKSCARCDPAADRRGNRLLRSHIDSSKAGVRKITLHRLYTARGSSGTR
jgi:DNA-binding GntR family transcriptional regulator